MEQQTVRKTYKYPLMPTPAQEQALDSVLWRCRTLDNCALEQRTTWWGRGQGKGATSFQQKAALPDRKAAPLEFTDGPSPVLQEGLLRVERTYHAFFRRVPAGQTPGYPRVQGSNRSHSHSCTYPPYGNGVVVDGGGLSLSKIGRIRLRLHRPLEGLPRRSPSAGKRTAGTSPSPSPVPRYLPSRCHPRVVRRAWR